MNPSGPFPPHRGAVWGPAVPVHHRFSSGRGGGAAHAGHMAPAQSLHEGKGVEAEEADAR